MNNCNDCLYADGVFCKANYEEIDENDNCLSFESRKTYEKGKLDGVREFAEYLCEKYSRIRQDSIGFEIFQNIYWKSIDEVLAEWEKGRE